MMAGRWNLNAVSFLVIAVIVAIPAVDAVQGNLPVRDLDLPHEEILLTDLAKVAFNQNPEIIAAKANWLAHKKRIGASWALPDPMVGFDIIGEETQTRVGPQEARFSVFQKIPFPWKLWEKRKVADHDAKAAYLRYLATQRDVLQKLRHAYYDLYLADASIQTINEIHELLKNLESVAQARYSKRSGTQRDVAKAQAEVSLTLEQLYRLRRKRESIAAFMNALLDRDPHLEFGRAVRPDLPKSRFEFVDLVNKAEMNRELIGEMEEIVKKVKHKKRLAWLEYMPDAEVGFTYTWVGSGRTRSADDGQDSWMIPVRIRVPLWQNRILSEIGEAKKRLEEAEAKLLMAKNETFYQVKDAYLRFDTASKIAILYETAIIPQAKLALTSDEAGYESGSVTFLELLDSERIYLNAKLGFLRVYNEALRSYVDLERATGLDFEGGER